MKTKVLSIIALVFAIYSCQTNKQEPMKQPIDSKATPETVALYDRLFKTMDKGIMLGHQDALAYGHDWYKEEGRSDVKSVTGDYPAVVGWELGCLELGAEFNLDSVYFSDMQKYIIETHRRGGITTCSWHGANIVTGENAWDCKQDNVVSSVLPNAENHAKYLTWLDKLATFFTSLKDDEGKLIPIVFRMYHENTGDWFWWCSKQSTPEDYKAMWTMTVDYLRDTKGVHNLLYAYSPSDIRDEAHFLERYPGDEYVDVIGFDTYVQVQESDGIERYKKDMARNLKIITDYCIKSDKLPIVAETGMESVTDSLYFTEVVYPIINEHKLAWILFWRNAWEEDKTDYHYYIPFEGHGSAKDLKNFASQTNILLNNDVKK